MSVERLQVWRRDLPLRVARNGYDGSSSSDVKIDDMNLSFGGIGGNVDLDEEEPLVSAHTGRSLRNGTIRIRIGREHDALMAALPGQILDSDEGRWRVVSRPQHSFQEGSRFAQHVFRIEEFENRAATMLQIADLELKPEKYYEDASPGSGLRITARVELRDPKQIDRLLEILAGDESFPVIRAGVQDAPRLMEIAVLGWSQQGDERVFELQCSEAEARQPGRLSGLHTAVASSSHAAFLLEWRLGVSELLIQKGIVSKDELDRVAETAEKNIGQRRIKFAQVADVRACPFGDE